MAASITLLISSLAFLSLALYSRADEATINRLCSFTSHPDACLECMDIEGRPEIKTANINDLLKTLVNCADARMETLTYNVHKLMDIAAKDDPPFRALLDQCAVRIDRAHGLFVTMNAKIDGNFYADAAAVATRLIAPGIYLCRDTFVRRLDFAMTSFAQNADTQCQNIIQILGRNQVKV